MASTLVIILTAQILVCLPAMNAYGRFRARLPNVGENSRVPAPFIQSITDLPQMTRGTTCKSIGHLERCEGSPSGQGNPFGKAFYAQAQANSMWTAMICNADSDGDSHSNGVELGDPDCVWTAGATPDRTTCLSHPGFACSTPTDPHCEGRTTAAQCAAVTNVATSAASATDSSDDISAGNSTSGSDAVPRSLAHLTTMSTALITIFRLFF